jgi:hypothetical protein
MGVATGITTTTATPTCTSPRSAQHAVSATTATAPSRRHAAAGVDDRSGARAPPSSDYDRDGDLDLFVANYLDFSRTANKQCFDRRAARLLRSARRIGPCPTGCSATTERALHRRLESPAIAKADGAGSGVATGDYNGDGWLDLYVANDATPNQLWINQKTARSSTRGRWRRGLNAAGNPEGSMGVASGDYDRTATRTCSSPTSSPRRSRCTPTTASRFRRRARGRGVAQPRRPSRGSAPTGSTTTTTAGWTCSSPTAAVQHHRGQRGQPVPYRMRNQLFRNLAPGKFSGRVEPGGPALRTSRGRSAQRRFGDLDQDG